MKKLALIFAFTPAVLFSQVKNDSTAVNDTIKHWCRGGAFAFNFTQSSFTNWAAGGVNSFAGQTLLGVFVNYKKDSVTWTNNLDLAFGLLQQGQAGIVRKTDDKIEFTSKFDTHAFDKYWDYSALLSFKTQFTQGFNYITDTSKVYISDFMSPAYALLGIGLDYKRNGNFSFFVSPLTGKTTYVSSNILADQGAFGMTKAEYDTAGNIIKHGTHIRNEFGGYVRIQYKADIMKNVNLAAKCEFFSNYLHTPQDVDVNAELSLTFKVNKYIQAGFNAQAIYDNDINIAVDKNHDGIIDAYGPRLQIKEVMGIGVTAKF